MTLLNSAVAIRRRVLLRRWTAATSLNNLGLAYMDEGKLVGVGKMPHREACEIRQKIFGTNNAQTATSLNDLSCVYRQEGRLTDAESMAAESALAVRQKLFTDDSLEVADSLRNLCIILGDGRKWGESGSERPAGAGDTTEGVWPGASRGGCHPR